MAVVSPETPYIDMDVAIDSLVRQFGGPGYSARAAKLQKKLDGLWSKYEKFEAKVEKNAAGSLSLGFGENYKVAKSAGIEDLSARYKGIEIHGPPDASGLLAVAAGRDSDITYSRTTFTEADANNGAVLQSMVATLTGDTFKGAVGASIGTITGLPSGLTAKLIKTSTTTATLTFSGKATANTSADTISNAVVEFSAADFTSGTIAEKIGLSQALKFQFFDILASETNGLLTLSSTIATNVTVNLITNKLLFGSAENVLQSGSMADVTQVDASELSGTGVGVNIIGDDDANIIISADLSGTITGGKGNDTITLGTASYTLTGAEGDDTITLGSGVTTLRFGMNSDLNGSDTITGFNVVGDSLDILDFSAFLGVTAATREPILVITDEAEQIEFVNGGLVVLDGNGFVEADNIVSAFNAPIKNGKMVIISADVSGDATVWFVTNTGADATELLSSEVVKVATLVGVNNLSLENNLFTGSNFL